MQYLLFIIIFIINILETKLDRQAAMFGAEISL